MINLLHGKRGISPLVMTVLLIAFSVAIGAVVMSWGETYIEEKAEFVQGYHETVTSCDLVYFEIIKIKGVPQVCKKNGAIEMLLSNGPDADINDFSIRLVGTEKAVVLESLLHEKFARNSVDRFTIQYPPVGNILQVKITPKTLINEKLISCPKAAIVIEEFGQC